MIEMFTLAGKSFCYQVSNYNGTRFNERAVEVPVGLALLTQAVGRGKQVLEVGAVLPHYLLPMASHTVIDLYELYPGVINANVLTWQPPQQYNLIVSISTLDHLHNESEFDCALYRLKNWLAPNGLLFITLPYGQPAWVGGGPWIDRFLLGENDADAVWRMDKIDAARHLWAQVEDATTPPLAYNGQSPAANSVYFLLWGSIDKWWHT